MKRYISTHSNLWRVLKTQVVDVGGFSAELYTIQSSATSTSMNSAILAILEDEELTPQLIAQGSIDSRASPIGRYTPNQHVVYAVPLPPTLALNSSFDAPVLLPISPPLLNSVSSNIISVSPALRPALVLSSPSLASLTSHSVSKPVSHYSPNVVGSHKRQHSIDNTVFTPLSNMNDSELELKKSKTLP